MTRILTYINNGVKKRNNKTGSCDILVEIKTGSCDLLCEVNPLLLRRGVHWGFPDDLFDSLATCTIR